MRTRESILAATQDFFDRTREFLGIGLFTKALSNTNNLIEGDVTIVGN